MNAGPASGLAGTEQRKIPPERARRHAQVTVTLLLVILAVIWVIPAWVLHPMADPAPLAFLTGLAVALGLALVRGVCNARGSRRLRSATSRFLTAPTWSGLRTIDLRDLRRVRARKIAGRLGSLTYLIVTDSAGVRVAFSDHKDIRVVRRALDERARQQPLATPVKTSRLARAVLGIQPLPAWASVLWSLASIEVTVVIMLGCTFTIILLAGK